MLSWLKKHPFGVEAHFESSIVLTFALPKEQLQSFIPACLTLDTYEDNLAFMAVAMVQTKDLRPKGFPAFMGNNFFLIGYRIFVRYKNNDGKNLRGLYILKSETDKKKMELLGNTFTKYSYTTSDILKSEADNSFSIESKKSDFKLTYSKETDEISLPPESIFKDWKEARRFAGPLPFTFSFNEANNEVLIIEGKRKQWIPKPLQILDYSFGFLKELNFENAILANAFVIENVPYHWKKGKIEKWIK